MAVTRTVAKKGSIKARLALNRSQDGRRVVTRLCPRSPCGAPECDRRTSGVETLRF